MDGTLAETERDGHRVAFNRAFAAAGLPWEWSEPRYGELLAVAGGRERLLHDMASRADAPADPVARAELATRLHRLKNDYYAENVAEHGVPLRPGVAELLDECAGAGIRLAIATTTSRGNVAALLSRHFGPQWHRRFASVVCAEDAPRKKPDPQVYRLALGALGVAAAEALAIEDSPAGVQAARASGIAVVVVRSAYFAAAAVDGAIAVGPSLGTSVGWQPPALRAADGRIGLAQLRSWHAGRGGA